MGSVFECIGLWPVAIQHHILSVLDGYGVLSLNISA